MKNERWCYVVAAVSGVLGWVVVAWMSGRREAWDSEWYFQAGIPAQCLVSAILGYLAPVRPWRWGAVPLGAQTLWMLASQGVGNLFPLGLMMGAVLAVPPVLAARFGAFLSRKAV
jgi:hypothetical protein